MKHERNLAKKESKKVNLTVFMIEDHVKQVSVKKDRRCAMVSCDEEWQKLLFMTNNCNYFCNEHVPTDIDDEDVKYLVDVRVYLTGGHVKKEELLKGMNELKNDAYYFVPRILDRDSLTVYKERKNKTVYTVVIPMDELNIVINGTENLHYLLKKNYTVYCGTKRKHVGDCDTCKRVDTCKKKWREVRDRMDVDVREVNIKRVKMQEEGKTIEFTYDIYY
jgi:hypothetical protein